MREFSCKVRLGGLLTNEVRKTGVTAAEILVLRAIHVGGEEPVIEIKPTGKATMEVDGKLVPRTDRAERERLESIYGSALQTREDIKNLNAILGVGVALPDTVEGVPHEVVPDGPVKRTVVPRKDSPADLSDLEAA